jgi:macrodomain Ter protein organizer (MatP/YcbG family)
MDHGPRTIFRSLSHLSSLNIKIATKVVTTTMPPRHIKNTIQQMVSSIYHYLLKSFNPNMRATRQRLVRAIDHATRTKDLDAICICVAVIGLDR